MQRAMVEAVKNMPSLAPYIKARYMGSVSGDTITMVFNSPDVASTTSIMSGASITIDLIS